MLKYIHITLKSSAMDFHISSRLDCTDFTMKHEIMQKSCFLAGETYNYNMTPKEFAVKKSACRFFTHPKNPDFDVALVYVRMWDNRIETTLGTDQGQPSCSVESWWLSLAMTVECYENLRDYFERGLLVSALGKDLELFCLESVVNLWINRAKWMYM